MTLRQMRYESYKLIFLKYKKDLALLDEMLAEVDAKETDPKTLALMDRELVIKPGSKATDKERIEVMARILERVMFATEMERQMFFEHVKLRTRPSRN